MEKILTMTLWVVLAGVGLGCLWAFFEGILDLGLGFRTDYIFKPPFVRFLFFGIQNFYLITIAKLMIKGH